MAETLLDRLIRRIATSGPLTVAEFMAEALHDRTHGYYASGDPLGRAGDFVTAPEISQMFGELIGMWTVSAWIADGAPEGACLVELGPGRGTLMADMLRAMSGVGDIDRAFEVHLVETNPALRRLQARALEPVRPVWHDDLSTLPARPWFVVANEFLDALPIRQLMRRDGVWREILVTARKDGGGLGWALERAPSPLAAGLPEDLAQGGEEGMVAELCPAAEAVAATIADQVSTHGGAALLIDYGSERNARGASLQAVRDHRKVDILEAPGETDLSSHVDFARLRAAALAAGAECQGPVEQGRFLVELGIEQRADALSRRGDTRQRNDIMTAVQRLIGPEEMGTLFKVFAVVPPDTPPLAGFR